MRILTVTFLFLSSFSLSIAQNASPSKDGQTWAARLGFPADKKVIILHADDLGMCPEANAAGRIMLAEDQIQSGSIMQPCPAADSMLAWYARHPDKDLGVHVTLTSEWKTYRWGPISQAEKVPGLIDPDGYLWREVREVATKASEIDVAREIRMQIEHSLETGVRPGHMDTHMGTVYARPDYAAAYLNLAMEYGIPAMVIEFTEEAVIKFRKAGYPIDKAMLKAVQAYYMPKLDDFDSVPRGATYEEKREAFFALVRSLKPGLTEIIFHPSVESENLKQITGSWQQRVWEMQLFADPLVQAFFQQQKIIFTNWKEVMQRYERMNKP